MTVGPSTRLPLPIHPLQQRPHIVVTELRETLVPDADRHERLRREEADHLVCLLLERPTHVRRRNRDRDDDARGLLMPQRGDRGADRGPRRHTIVHQDHDPSLYPRRRPSTTVRTLPPLALRPPAGG